MSWFNRKKADTQPKWEPVRQPDLNPKLAGQLHDLTNEWGDPDSFETYGQATYNILVSAFQAHVAALVDEGQPFNPGTIGSVLAGLSDYQYDESLWGDAFVRPPVRPKSTEEIPPPRRAAGRPYYERTRPNLVASPRPAGNLSPETRRRTGADHLDDITGLSPLIGSGYVSGPMYPDTVGKYAMDISTPPVRDDSPAPTPSYTSDFGSGGSGYASGSDTSYTSPSSTD